MKDQPTPRQHTAVRAQRARGDRLREWLQQLAQRPKAKATASAGGHGKTQELAALPGVRPQWVHEHSGGITPRERRVRFPTAVGAEYVPFRNPARYDATVGTDRERRIARQRANRLRKELQS